MSITPELVLIAIGAYALLLLGIAWFTGRKVDSDGYFVGNRKSLWYLVAFGMLSDSMSGVSFISVPGDVAKQGFGYLQTVMGYVLGYVVIAFVLLPLYYKLNLTSIYTYLGGRFHRSAQKTGSVFFLISRLSGSAARLFATAAVIQLFVFDRWGWPFSATVILIIALILVYTIRGGIKTLVITDALQSLFLLAGLLLSVVAIVKAWPEGKGIWESISNAGHTRIINNDPYSADFFWKQFISGMFVCIAMTGLDQNMMQKNLSCRSLRDAQKNMLWFSAVLVLVNVLFVSLGALLLEHAKAGHIALPLNGKGLLATDRIFPFMALEQLGLLAGMAFIIGLTAATFSSADSVLTSLTTSCYIDLLELDRRTDISQKARERLRMAIHFGFAILLFGTILLFKTFNDQALIKTVLKLAGYTYGPLLALFVFGRFTRLVPAARWVPVICLASPILTWIIDHNSQAWLGGYAFGNEVLLLNAGITLLGLWAVSKKMAPTVV
jgi:SSS family transporter